MISELKLALVQMDCRLGRPHENLARIEELLREAAAGGSQLAVFPELCTTGYNLSVIGKKIPSMALNLDSPEIKRLKDLCRDLCIYAVIPMALCGPEGQRPYNGLIFIDDKGRLIGTYAKCHLYDQERNYFQPGNDFPVFDTPLGKIGCMICYDAGFPESARLLRLKGAELILCPSAWNARDKIPWDLNMAQRALENSCYLAAVNRFGREEDLYMAGWSQVTAPDGRVIVKMSEEKEGILYCSLDGDVMNTIGPKGGPYLRWRRPQLYGPIGQ